MKKEELETINLDSRLKVHCEKVKEDLTFEVEK